MDYTEFLEALKGTDWLVPNKSFASKTLDGAWQMAFVRIGGRKQLPGMVTFVICIRHTLLRDVEKRRLDVVKDPFHFPFKLLPQDIASGKLVYRSNLLNYETINLDFDANWTPVFVILEEALPKMLRSYSPQQLRDEILKYGEHGYIEQIWSEDLA